MIGISGIASFIPDTKIDNLEQGEVFGESPEFIINKIGAKELPVSNTEVETSDLGCQAITRLVDSGGLDLESVDALVVVTQNPDDSGLPHTSAIIHKKLGLSKSVAAFDVSLGCSGYVYGLSILRGLMDQAGLSNGILVTADPYSRIVDRKDKNTSLLFGDAATATWLSRHPLWVFGVPLLETDGDRGGALMVREDGFLSMHGRNVFNFAASEIPSHIDKLLARENLSIDSVDLFCLHQGSRAIIEAIARKFPSAKDRFIIDLDHTGNTVSSSIPLLLENYVVNSKQLKRVLISGFGVGLSWATNILERYDDDSN